MKFPIFLTLLLLLNSDLFAVELIDRPTDGRQYEILKFRFEENLHFKNAFDLEINKVELHIIQPDFTNLHLSFFYNGLNKNNVEKWEARFTPKQAGNYRFGVFINGKMDEQFDLPVETNDDKNQGGLVLSEKPGVFEYESGEAFRGIGINVCWAEDFEYYFKKMQANGMNITRIWLCPLWGLF